MGDTVRTFLAVELAPPIHAELVALKAELAATGAPVRWVRDEGLHATIKFLGAVPTAALPGVQEAVAAAAHPTPVLPAAVRGVGAFPSLRRPRVIWVGLEAPGLAELAAAVDRALEPLGFAPERRPFRGHVTLGRAAGTGSLAVLDALLQRRRDTEFGRCTLGEVIAYRSDLRRGGAVYTKLWTSPLGGFDR